MDNLTRMAWTITFVRRLKLGQFIHVRNLSRTVALEPCKSCQTHSSIMTFHRLQHSTAGTWPWKCKLAFGWRSTGVQNVRSLTTTNVGLCQKGKTSEPDSEYTYIEKELAAENKLTKKQKRASADLRNSMVNVGRLVPNKVLELLDEDGTSLGTVNRDQAVALSQEKKLKLVLLKPQSKPWPLYKLMTGQELHQEQLKRNEKMKKQTAQTQVKEVKTSWNIGDHDLDVRRRQLDNWFSDDHSHVHVRVTVKGGKALAGNMSIDGDDEMSKEKQEEIMQQLMKVINRLMTGMEDRITLNGPPQLAGKNLTTLKATLRAMSAKEKTAYKKNAAEKPTDTK